MPALGLALALVLMLALALVLMLALALVLMLADYPSPIPDSTEWRMG